MRSLPACGSVMPSEPIASPETIFGNQRLFCASLPKLAMYVATRSQWIMKPGPVNPERAISSKTTTSNR